MNEEITINNTELVRNLAALAWMCESRNTDNCNLTICTERGKIMVHIDFEYEANEKQE